MSTTPVSESNVFLERCKSILVEEDALRKGGDPAGHERQRKLGRLPVRERIVRLLDDPGSFLELGLWAGYKMYEAWGEIPAAGVVTGIGSVSKRPCMVIANDATVKAGAFFPQTAKKFCAPSGSPLNARCQSSISSIPPVSFFRCRTRFFRTKTILAESFATTPSSRLQAFRNMRPSWETVWPVALICRFSAIKF